MKIRGEWYKKAKTLDQFLEEMRAESGTRYASYMVELMERPEVQKDIRALLQVTREQNYRNTYHVLESVFRKTS